MVSNQIMFILFAAMIIVFSVLTVTTRKILRAAVYLLFVLVSTSGLYFMVELPVPCSCSADTLCRRYCCSDHFLDTSNKPYKPEI